MMDLTGYEVERIGDDRLHYWKGKHHIFTDLEGKVTLAHTLKEDSNAKDN